MTTDPIALIDDKEGEIIRGRGVIEERSGSAPNGGREPDQRGVSKQDGKRGSTGQRHHGRPFRAKNSCYVARCKTKKEKRRVLFS